MSSYSSSENKYYAIISMSYLFLSCTKKGDIQIKASYLDDATEAQVISWMPKCEIKLLKPDVLHDLALRSTEQVIHLVNLESRKIIIALKKGAKKAPFYHSFLI